MATFETINNMRNNDVIGEIIGNNAQFSRDKTVNKLILTILYNNTGKLNEVDKYYVALPGFSELYVKSLAELQHIAKSENIDLLNDGSRFNAIRYILHFRQPGNQPALSQQSVINSPRSLIIKKVAPGQVSDIAIMVQPDILVDDLFSQVAREIYGKSVNSLSEFSDLDNMPILIYRGKFLSENFGHKLSDVIPSQVDGSVDKWGPVFSVTDTINVGFMNNLYDRLTAIGDIINASMIRSKIIGHYNQLIAAERYDAIHKEFPPTMANKYIQ